MKKKFIIPNKKVANTLVKDENNMFKNNAIINENREIQKGLVPLREVTDITFELLLTQEINDKIMYMCSRFPNLEWSGVLFYKHDDNTVTDIKSMKLTAIDFYPLDIGSSTYTEFSHSTDFAGYIASNPEYMDMKQGLIHSHNNMQTFFSGTDNNTLREMTPIYKNYLSLIVNNRGETTVGLGVLREIKGKKIEESFVYSHDFKTKFTQKEEKEYKEQVVLKYLGNVTKEKTQEHLLTFEEIVNSLEKRKKEEQLNKQRIDAQRRIEFHPTKDYNTILGHTHNNFIPKDALEVPKAIKDRDSFVDPTEEDVFNFLYRLIFLDLERTPAYHDYRSNINYLEINLDRMRINKTIIERFHNFIKELFKKLGIKEIHDKIMLLNYCQEFLRDIDNENAIILEDILLDYEDSLIESPF